jgi:regulation of enolase protein 1 (concanavalin A-like superfamily)
MNTGFRQSIILTMCAFLSSGLLAAAPQDASLGDFESHADVGSPKLPGSAAYDPAAQQYTLSGAGTNMWFTTDQFHFLSRKMQGDFILRARVEFVGKGAIAHRKIGWMVRPSLDPGAAYADCAEHGDGLTSLQFRRAAGSNTEQLTLPITNADVLQFERKEDTFIFSAARYGEPFTSVQLTNLDLGDDVYAGLFICSHTADVVEKAIFRDVRIIRPARLGFVPYHDFIGSVLEILDVQSGKLEQIYKSDEPFEAPNWTRDGHALIYNISGRGPRWGRLCRFDLATRTPTLLDTGPCVRNNNDHVLSFDGTLLGISDQSDVHGGQSRVFTLPVTGGIPKAITPLTPSYFHGWSPDGKFLVYTGGRNGKFDIYKIRSDASRPETRLTDSPGLSDGPEFAPDGKHIYFNSTRGGSMQLWRMKPNGKDQEQLTDDQFNNWFPHISPDGKWIAFISFGRDIDPKDHPYYKQVCLRLMPVNGGKPKVIAYVYGGQGTMNVPSWSPDSTRIAFVSNTR